MSKSSKVQFICISLKQSLERREKVLNQIQKLRECITDIEIDFEFFDGIYGKDLAPEYLSFINIAREQAGQCKRPMSTGEIGCMLSHLFLWQRISEQRYANYDRVVIIEDDVYLAEHHQHTAQLHSILNNPAEFIFLSGHSKKARTRILGYVSADHTHFNMLGSRYQYSISCAYTATPEQAKKMLYKLIKKPSYLDDWKYLLSNLYSVPYYYFFDVDDEQVSTIGAERENFSASNRTQVNRITKNAYKIWQDFLTYLKCYSHIFKIRRLSNFIQKLK